MSLALSLPHWLTKEYCNTHIIHYLTLVATMPNRYCRDQLIKIALDMALLPNLEHHDIPDGVVMPNAFSIQWLQDIIDFWYHMVPFSATVGHTILNCTANCDTIVLPSDFILDVKNRYHVQTVPGNNRSYKKTFRLPLQQFLNAQLGWQTNTGTVFNPQLYTICGDDGNPLTQYQTMLVTPTPTIATQGILWYYRLPPVLTAIQRPKFPSDYVCIEYIRIRAVEWAGIMQPGTAYKFCDKVVSAMKVAGLMNEPEDNEVPLDPVVYRASGDNAALNNYSWMGPV
jgi:hypothetical protein